MATTGRLPPNAGHGATFIHDAKLSDVTEVKGQIRLRFVNVSGKKITVTRNYQATQRKKGGTAEYKQLESNVQMVGESPAHAYARTRIYAHAHMHTHTTVDARSCPSSLVRANGDLRACMSDPEEDVLEQRLMGFAVCSFAGQGQLCESPLRRHGCFGADPDGRVPRGSRACHLLPPGGVQLGAWRAKGAQGEIRCYFCVDAIL